MFTSLVRSIKSPALSSFKNLSKSAYYTTIIPLSHSHTKHHSIYSSQFPSFCTIKKRIATQTKEEFDELQRNISFHGEQHQSVIDSYIKLGNVYDLDNNHEEALGFHYKALKLSIDIHGAADISVAGCYSNIGQSYFYAGKNDLALESHQKALKLYSQTVQQNDIRVGTCFDNIGAVYCSEGRYEEGLKFYEKALKIYQKNSEEDESDVLNLYEELAIVYKELKRYDEAIFSLKKIVHMKTSLFGDKDADLADSYCALGVAYMHKGDSVSALKRFQDALVIYKVNKSSKREIVECYQNIGLAQIEQRKYNEATEAFDKALTHIKKSYNNPTALLMNNEKYIGKVLYYQAKYTEALEHFKNALDIESQINDEDSDPIELYTLIAEVHEKQNNAEKAVEYYIKAAEANKVENGEIQKSLAEQYTRISKLYQQIGKEKESSEYSEKAQDIQSHLSPVKPATQGKKTEKKTAEKTHKKEGGPANPLSEMKKEAERLSKSKGKEDMIKVAKLYDEIANVYYGQEKYREARESFERAQKNWKKVYGENSLEIAGSYNNLAGALLGEGKSENALKTAEKALGAIKKALGDENTQMAGTYMNLGRILVHMENYERGLEYFRRAYEMRKKVLGEEAEETKVAEQTYNELKDALDEGKLE